MFYFNKLKATLKDELVKYFKAIDWNTLEDELDKQTWEKLTSQFWLDTRVPVSNDLPDWRELSPSEKDVYNKAFVGLTLLDTLQSEEGAVVMLRDARTQHEKAVLSNIHFMESVHAKSYSTIFQSLNNTSVIDEIFEWGNTDKKLQYKAEKINSIYQLPTNTDDEKTNVINGLKKKVASVFLESFLFYSGFYTPLWYAGNGRMTNVAEIIKLILRDEATHGTYLGLKHEIIYNTLTEEEKQSHHQWAIEFLAELYANEVAYTKDIYTQIGWVNDVLLFVRYNANKALQNLGFEPIFEDGIPENVNPIVMNGISTESSNHDFFSKVGNSYLMGEAESMEEDDYDF